MEIEMNLKKNAAKATLILGSIAALSTWGQQPPAPTSGDLACKEESAIVPTDTVVSTPDAEGYLSLFDGTFKGWFNSCKTGHSNNSPLGAIFRIGQADGKPAIYTTHRQGGIGGVLMTNKKFANYEIEFEFWPTYQDDGGIFNRTDIGGNCFQTVLDYINGGAIGGTWGEGNFGSRDIRPFRFNSGTDPKAISVGTEATSWANVTKTLKAGSEPEIPCAASGCTREDWLKLWDFAGWNSFKVQFYGGVSSGTGNIHMKAWFRKPADKVWVPLSQDTTLARVVPAGFIGIQVHGNSGWQDNNANWYRNIRWKPLDNTGKPTITVSARKMESINPIYNFAADASSLAGYIDQDYTISLQDVSGKTLETFSGKAGYVRHSLTSVAHGVLFLNIRTSAGMQKARVVRPIR
jgi:hypothetical protein